MDRFGAFRDIMNTKQLTGNAWCGQVWAVRDIMNTKHLTGNGCCGQVRSGQGHNEYKTVNRECPVWTDVKWSETL